MGETGRAIRHADSGHGSLRYELFFFFFFRSILPPKLAELSDHVDFWEQAELRGELGWVGFYFRSSLLSQTISMKSGFNHGLKNYIDE